MSAKTTVSGIVVTSMKTMTPNLFLHHCMLLLCYVGIEKGIEFLPKHEVPSFNRYYGNYLRDLCVHAYIGFI